MQTSETDRKKIETKSKVSLQTTEEKLAEKCWCDCMGNCSPFRTGIVHEPSCGICPGRRQAD